MYKIGIDVGGTFTDFVVAGEGGQPRFFKTQTTPGDPSIGVMTGLHEAAAAYGLSLEHLLRDTDLVIHGSTVATNTLVERKGAKVGLITTDGFRDLLEMREGLKEDRYNLRMQPSSRWRPLPAGGSPGADSRQRPGGTAPGRGRAGGKP